jgi:hypothetical protein
MKQYDVTCSWGMAWHVKTFLLNDLVDFISCYLFHFLAPEVHIGTSSNMLLVIH